MDGRDRDHDDQSRNSRATNTGRRALIVVPYDDESVHADVAADSITSGRKAAATAVNRNNNVIFI